MESYSERVLNPLARSNSYTFSKAHTLCGCYGLVFGFWESYVCIVFDVWDYFVVSTVICSCVGLLYSMPGILMWA